MDDWSADIKRDYEAARRSACLSYGAWQVIKVANAVVSAGPANVYKRVDIAYAVADAGGNVIATVEHRDVALLLAQIPDMCDTCLRPRVSSVVEGGLTTWGDATVQTPKLLGVVEPARLWSHAMDAGYSLGFEEGYIDGMEDAPKGETDAG